MQHLSSSLDKVHDPQNGRRTAQSPRRKISATQAGPDGSTFPHQYTRVREL